MLEILAVRSPRGVTEIADQLGLKKSSVSRLLKALAELGYAEQSTQRGQYRLSAKVLLLAQCYLKDDPLVTAAQPILHELALAVRAARTRRCSWDATSLSWRKSRVRNGFK